MANDQSVKSFRNNTETPAGNVTQAQENQLQNLLPKTQAIKSLAENLFGASGYNDSILNTIGIVPQQTVSFQLINTGLVDKLMLAIKGTVNVKNTLGSAQAVSLAYEFPFNIIQNLNTQFNGQVTLNSASGYEFLALAGKRNKQTLNTDFAGYLSRTLKSVRVSRKTANITAGANVTLTAGDGLTGYSGFSVAASSTGVLNFEMTLEIPFTFRKDIPVGLLALQNNSINCQVQITAATMLGTTPVSPMYVATAIPSTLSVDSTAINATPVQFYWETPNDKRLYQYFVANSYMFLSVPGNLVKATGVQALQYQMPNNYILTSLLFTLRDANFALIDTNGSLDNPTLNYNNTTNVDKMPLQIRDYLQERFYQGMPNGLGQLLWDACTHEYEGNNFSDSSFLNMYTANNPQFYIDILSGVTAPLTYSVARETIVPAQVKVV